VAACLVRLLNKPVKINQRNQTLDDFMAEIIPLRNGLSAIGNNYNQTVKSLHSLGNLQGMKTWLILNETAWEIIQYKIREIKEKSNQNNNIWLR
jgi:uncharacterized protein YggL (DUF469 family)